MNRSRTSKKSTIDAVTVHPSGRFAREIGGFPRCLTPRRGWEFVITLSEGQFQQVGEFFCDEIFQYVINYYRILQIYVIYIYNIEDMTCVYDIVYIFLQFSNKLVYWFGLLHITMPVPCIADANLFQVSFVNSINTIKGRQLKRSNLWILITAELTVMVDALDTWVAKVELTCRMWLSSL